MAFFEIQNHSVSVEEGAANIKRKVIGDSERSYSGKPLSTQKSIKNEWSIKTTWLTELNWRFLTALLNGEGHVWNFNSSTEWAYSSKGLGPTSGTAANGTRYTTASKFGSAAMRVAAASYVQFNVGYTDKWTALLWYGSTFADHIIVNDAGDKWLNGVSSGSAVPFVTMSGGNLRIGDSGAGGFQYFDDLIVIPERINDEWAADFGTMNAAFGGLPLIKVGGNLMWSNTYLAQGFDVNIEMGQGIVDGAWEGNLGRVSATIYEDSKV